MNNKQTWVIASSNQGKIAEINQLLAPHQITLTAQSEYNVVDVPETATTFIENALIKARHACVNTNLPSLADDSGLVVPALNGEPGLYSARYAGTKNPQDNINKLLTNLKNTPEYNPDRMYGAYFYCVIVLLRHQQDPSPIICEGVWHGKISFEPKGENGFGYDPIFFSPQLNLTAAQMTAEQKQTYSHRGQALRKLLKMVQQDG